MKTDALITIKGLSVGYDGKEVLNCPSLEIKKQDFIGVIGPNGGGKTTLVKAILKSIPYNGSIEYSPEIASGGLRKIGYLPQIHNIDKSFPITVNEVVLSGLQVRKGMLGRYSHTDHQKVKDLLEITGINHLSNKVIGELSGGEFQRVMLCRAIISDPILLILDEPNNFVDNHFENELYQLLGRLNDRMTIVMVSHDVGTLTQYIKSVVCVNRSVHYHDSNQITPEQLLNYNCPIQLVYHGDVPHTVLRKH